jgi:hypothetical protein
MKSGAWKSKIIDDRRIIFVNDDYGEFADNGGTTKCQGNITNIKLFAGNKLKNSGDILPFILPCMTIAPVQPEKLIEKVNT